MKKPTQTRRRWLYVAVAAAVVSIASVVVVSFFPEQEKSLRRQIRTSVERAFPQQAAQVAESYGLTLHGDAPGFAAQPDPAAPSVVLVHGLDDPGKVWMNLAPVLADQRINVWQLDYPNDQQIEDSARFFHDQLKRLTRRGIEQVAVVAHSMGGLVSREMLTNPRIAYATAADGAAAPRVVALIMVGTPNQGSEFARFRVLGEIRDQWASFLHGRGHILRGILDGAGEAKIDLLPGSRFLTTLNERPHPQGVNMLSIAGNISPWDDRDIDRLVNSMREQLPAVGQDKLAGLGALLRSMGDGLGDGLVTVESTRLEGVEHRTVSGTHLSMIRNVSVQSDRVPPAVPLIVRYLTAKLSI